MTNAAERSINADGASSVENADLRSLPGDLEHFGVSDRVWERLGLATLLVGTGVAYLWNITVNGMGNGFYAASAQAGAENWKALLFGSLDRGNFITVDKPPVSQWVMGLSGQLFGFSSASMLVPQGLMAVAAVALLYGAVAEVRGRGAGLLAGGALALMPVAVMMFRFNNPDAVMVLLMTAGAYCTIRALPRAGAGWLALAGVTLGFAFLAKMLEGLMVLPALGIAYLVAAPSTLGKRLLHLLGAGAALVASSGWYVVLTMLWPKYSRPYMAGSTDDTFMDLVFGYNGLQRIQGRDGAGRAGMPAGVQPQEVYPGRGGSGFGGVGSHAGGARLFTGEIGFEISWLIPAALLACALVLVARGRRPRTDLVRAGAVVFGVWLVVDGIVFSYMNGGMHAYYTLAIAPAIAGLFGLGVAEMWRLRGLGLGRYGSAALIVASGGWGFILLQRNSDWLPFVRWSILVVTIVTAVGVVATSWSGLRRFSTVLIVLGVLAGLGGTSAYAAATLGQAHTGGSPVVGPAEPGRRGSGGYPGTDTASPALTAMLRATTTRWSAAIDRSSPAAALELASDTAVMAIGGFKNDPTPTLGEFQDFVQKGEVTYYIAMPPRNSRTGEPGQQPAPDQPSAHRAPAQGHGSAPGAGQTGDQSAVSDQQTTSGPGPTAGRQPGSGQGRGGSQSSGHADIAEWVGATFTPMSVGSATVYNLRQPK
ncbi:glycosyltransferase family 39 protein [Nocardia sp. NPDC051463]|uniref:ArnT family glycosyltransferase n=1 Tax=Nocardia sp. NPDC051463 TaxID=3154845 RepID=UPI003416B668